MLQKVKYLITISMRQRRTFEGLDRQAAQLFEAFGQMNYEPAEPLMRRFVPKGMGGEYARSAAIYSLGKMHLGKPDDLLAAAIAARVTEPSEAMPAEMHRVRVAGAIALGHMKATSQAEPLRGFASKLGVKLYLAIQWSLREITGEELPPPPPVISFKRDWFLEPLVDDSK
jgi:hypothetical protein